MTPTEVIQPLISPSFITLSGGDGGVTNWQREAFYQFPVDSVIHWVAIDSTFRLVANGAATECALAVSTYGEALAPTFSGAAIAGLVWRSSAVMEAAGTVDIVSKSVVIDAKSLFVRAGSTWGVYLIARGSSQVSFNVNMAFSNAQQFLKGGIK